MEAIEIASLPGCRLTPVPEGRSEPRFPNRDVAENSVVLPEFLQALEKTLKIKSRIYSLLGYRDSFANVHLYGHIWRRGIVFMPMLEHMTYGDSNARRRKIEGWKDC